MNFVIILLLSFLPSILSSSSSSSSPSLVDHLNILPTDIYNYICTIVSMYDQRSLYNMSLVSKQDRNRIIELAEFGDVDRVMCEALLTMRLLNNCLVERHLVDAEMYERLFRDIRVSQKYLYMVPFHISHNVDISYEQLPAPTAFQHTLYFATAIILGLLMMPLVDESQAAIACFSGFTCSSLAMIRCILDQSPVQVKRSVDNILTLEVPTGLLMPPFVFFQVIRMLVELTCREDRPVTYFVESLLIAMLAFLVARFLESFPLAVKLKNRLCQ